MSSSDSLAGGQSNVGSFDVIHVTVPYVQIDYALQILTVGIDFLLLIYCSVILLSLSMFLVPNRERVTNINKIMFI